MRNEQRNSDRYCFNLDLQPEGELFLLTGDQTFEVWKLLDISPFGACVSLETNIEKGSQIELQYRCRGKINNAFGAVAWSDHENKLEDGAGFRMGIELHRDKMAINAALFSMVTAPT